MRQAARSLLRPGNATRAIVVTLASALSVLLTIYLVEHNLHGTYIASYPADAPNLFCLDIQKNQKQQFLKTCRGAGGTLPNYSCTAHFD